MCVKRRKLPPTFSCCCFHLYHVQSVQTWRRHECVRWGELWVLGRLRQYKISPDSGANLLFALIIAPVLVWSGNKLENQTAGSSTLFFAEHINPTAAFLIAWRSALSNCHNFPELPNGSGVQISSTSQRSHTLKCWQSHMKTHDCGSREEQTSWGEVRMFIAFHV